MTANTQVTFLPSGLMIEVERGATVLDAARAAGVSIVAPCGGRGICGSCGVRVVAGVLDDPDEIEMQALSKDPGGVRLACRARVSGSVTVRPLTAGVEIIEAPAPRAVDPDGASVVVAVDLGTTNVTALVVETDGGRDVGSATVRNQQAAWGADVLTRISSAQEGAAADLQAAAERSVSDAVRIALPDGSHVERIVVAANTAVSALLAGEDTASLGVAPHLAPELPVRLDARSALAAEFDCDVLVVPPIAGFIGGDVLSGSVHTGLLYATAPSLLVDVGTNAEVLLATGVGDLFAASAAAGPAFEGAGIRCGGAGVPGAVDAVDFEEGGVIGLRTIGGLEPKWFSGAGLLSVLRALRHAGHLDANGLMSREGPLDSRFFVDEEGVLCVRLGEARGCLEVSQRDVRGLQLAKAAVLAGVRGVLRAAAVEVGELAVVYVAGAFGRSIAAQDLIELGVLPEKVAGRLEVVGNASVAGASAMALDPGVLRDAVERASRVRHIDLAADPGFMRELLDATNLAPA